MSKTRHERIRELLMPRELVVYEASVHGIAYAAPIVGIIAGFLLTFITELGLYGLLPRALQEEWWPAVRGLREVHFGVLLMLMGAAFLIQVHSRRKNEILLITNQRVIDVTGMLIEHVEEIYLGRIEEVKIKRSIWGRLLHRGDVIIIGIEKDEWMHLQGISEPEKFHHALMLNIERFGKTATGKKK